MVCDQLLRPILAVVIMVVGLSPAIAASKLEGSEWSPMDNSELFIQFRADGKVSGFGGCNRFFGTFLAQAKKIKIGPLASTRKFCGAPVMEAEGKFLQDLEDSNSFSRHHIALELFNVGGGVLMKLRRNDWD